MHALIRTFERVYMRVMNPRHRHASVEINDPRCRADMCGNIIVSADCHDPTIANRRGLGPTPLSIHRVDAATLQDDVSRLRRRLMQVAAAAEEPQACQYGYDRSHSRIVAYHERR